MHDLGQAEIPAIRASQWTYQELGVIRHHDGGVQVEPVAVFLHTAPQHNISGLCGKFPAVVCSKGEEDWPIVLLNVGKTSAAIIVRLHRAAGPGAARPGQRPAPTQSGSIPAFWPA